MRVGDRDGDDVEWRVARGANKENKFTPASPWRLDPTTNLPPIYKVAWSRKIRHEQFCLAAHYALALAILPAPVFAGAVLLSGFMSATIVTVSLGFRGFKPSPSTLDPHPQLSTPTLNFVLTFTLTLGEPSKRGPHVRART